MYQVIKIIIEGYSINNFIFLLSNKSLVRHGLMAVVIFKLNVVIKSYLFWKIQHTFINLQIDCQLRLVHNFPVTPHRTRSLENGWMEFVVSLTNTMLLRC